MTDTSGGGVLFQQNFLDHIKALTLEINQVNDLINSSNDEKDKTRKISGSLDRMIEVSVLMENDSLYFFELHNCQRLMMTDNLQYIMKLEQELKELKL